MLKKQTVWLLTMLSLMIVLSIYYITSQDSNELAYVNKDDNDVQAKNDNAEVVDDMVNTGEDQLYASIRLETENARSKEISRLEDVVASSSSSTAEKNSAYDKMDTIEGRVKKENILEDSILASTDYSDVLVRYDKNDNEIVHVDVKTSKALTKKEVIDIMQSVQNEFGDITVDVNYRTIDS